MSHYQYLIMDAEKMAAVRTGSTLHKPDSHGSIGLVGKILGAPGSSISESLWKGNEHDPGVAFHFGQAARLIDLKTRSVTDHVGQVCTFEKLLLATRGTPRQLPFGEHRIIYFRTLRDYQNLRLLAEKGSRFAVIGGGFMGAEVAAALAMHGKEVAMIFPDKEIGGRIFPVDLGPFLNEYFRKKGVVIRAQESVTELKTDGEFLRLETKNKYPVAANTVVVGFNIQPDVALAEMAGLEAANGTEFLCVSDSSPNTVFPHSFGKCMPAVSQDHIQTEAKRMESTPYHHLPLFKSDFLNWNMKQPAGWAHSLTLFRIGRSHLTQV